MLAQVARGTAERFIKRCPYIMSDICDRMNLKRRSIDCKDFHNPVGVTSYATLEESCLVLHSYFEHYQVTFDLTVDIAGASPNTVYADFKEAICYAVRKNTGHEPALLIGQFFDRNTGRPRFERAGNFVGGDHADNC